MIQKLQASVLKSFTCGFEISPGKRYSQRDRFQIFLTLTFPKSKKVYRIPPFPQVHSCLCDANQICLPSRIKERRSFMLFQHFLENHTPFLRCNTAIKTKITLQLF